MDNTLLGVLVGGLLAGIGTWISLWQQHKKWKIEQKIKILEHRKEKFEKLSQTTLDKINDGMSRNRYDSEMMSDIDFLFPENVSKIFNNFMSKEAKDDNDKRETFYSIAREMKKAIKSIDDEIDKLLE